jgi:four helix bundle protein
MTSSELQDRLINFAVSIIKLTKSLTSDVAGKVMLDQLVRSGTSPALNYGEAVGAESSNDFIHKMQIVLKELRESFVALTIIQRADLCKDTAALKIVLDENNQLISIFVKSITTNKLKKAGKK